MSRTVQKYPLHTVHIPGSWVFSKKDQRNRWWVNRCALIPRIPNEFLFESESVAEMLHNPYHFLKPTYSERAWQFRNLLNKQEVMAHRNDLGSGNCDAAWWRLIFRSTSKWMGRRKADSEWEWWARYMIWFLYSSAFHTHTRSMLLVWRSKCWVNASHLSLSRE